MKFLSIIRLPARLGAFAILCAGSLAAFVPAEAFSQAIDDIVNGTVSAQEALDWAQDQIESP